jgi:hypothetical protein
MASRVSALPAVREALQALQLAFAGAGPGGRRARHGHGDLPGAPLKVFLTASAAERAERRHKQLISKGIPASIADLRADMEARDERDQSRSVAPLKPAEDALLLDNSARHRESVDQVLGWWQQRSRWTRAEARPEPAAGSPCSFPPRPWPPGPWRAGVCSTQPATSCCTHRPALHQLPPGTRKPMSQTQTATTGGGESFAALFEESLKKPTCASAKSSLPKWCASTSTTWW